MNVCMNYKKCFKIHFLVYDAINIFIFSLYEKMSEDTNLTYYQRNREAKLNKSKDYYKNNKDRIREQAREKYRNLSEEGKNIKREYGKNRYYNIRSANNFSKPVGRNVQKK